jgi:hypothetical protein
VNLKAQQDPQAKGSTGPTLATAQASISWVRYTLCGTELSGLWPSHAIPLLLSPQRGVGGSSTDARPPPPLLSSGAAFPGDCCESDSPSPPAATER